MKWVYLKSNSHSDALALATVLSVANEPFGVVRKSMVTQFLKGLNNVEIGYYNPNLDGQCIVLDCSCYDKWKEKCKYIADTLSIHISDDINPYLGFVTDNQTILDCWGTEKAALLYLIPYSDQNLDLMIIDRVTKLYAEKGVNFKSAGSAMIPCIKGTSDFRELIGINEICLLNKEHISFLLTSEIDIVTIAEALGIPASLISSMSELRVDNIPMTDANQIFNYTSVNVLKN